MPSVIRRRIGCESLLVRCEYRTPCLQRRTLPFSAPIPPDPGRAGYTAFTSCLQAAAAKLRDHCASGRPRDKSRPNTRPRLRRRALPPQRLQSRTYRPGSAPLPRPSPCHCARVLRPRPPGTPVAIGRSHERCATTRWRLPREVELIANHAAPPAASPSRCTQPACTLWLAGVVCRCHLFKSPLPNPQP